MTIRQTLLTTGSHFMSVNIRHYRNKTVTPPPPLFFFLFFLKRKLLHTKRVFRTPMNYHVSWRVGGRRRGTNSNSKTWCWTIVV